MKFRLAARLLGVLAHLLRGLLICGLVFPWLGREQRLASIGRWSEQLLRIFRVSVELEHGGGAVTHGLWVANHVSWIDIFVINAVFPSRFVAKSEVRSWPLVGPLSARAGTIFVTRAKPRDLRHTVATLVAALQAGERIVVFPEGTSSAQGAMQPFRTNLFQAAITAEAPVQPLAISYFAPDGSLHGAVEYIGDTSLIESIIALLSGNPICARLSISSALPPAASDRRELALRAHLAVHSSLASSKSMLSKPFT